MMLADAVGRELQGCERLLAAFGGRAGHLVLGDAHAHRRKVDLIELARQVDQRGVAARFHVGDDLGDGCVDVGGDLALLGQKGCEGLLKARGARFQPLRHLVIGLLRPSP